MLLLLIVQLNIIETLALSPDSPQLHIDLRNHIGIVQFTVNACSDFTSQCIIVRINNSSCIYYHPFYSPESSKIYRCWIMWGKNIRIVIVPSFLAITQLGQPIYLLLVSRF